jgi:hypothetical protein
MATLFGQVTPTILPQPQVAANDASTQEGNSGSVSTAINTSAKNRLRQSATSQSNNDKNSVNDIGTQYIPFDTNTHTSKSN